MFARSIGQEDRKKQEEAASKAKGPSFFDPYFDIVQVTVYGQARFFNPPPPRLTRRSRPAPERRRLRRLRLRRLRRLPPPHRGPMVRLRPAQVPRPTRREGVGSGEGRRVSKTDGATDDATKKTESGSRRRHQKDGLPAAESASKKDEGSPEAGKSAAPAAASKNGTEAAAPKRNRRDRDPRRADDLIATEPFLDNSFNSESRDEEMPAWPTRTRSSKSSRNLVCATVKRPGWPSRRWPFFVCVGMAAKQEDDRHDARQDQESRRRLRKAISTAPKKRETIIRSW